MTPATPRPSGTVTFLFSDIEGSTERWERDRDAMGAALRRHDALVRTAIERRGGSVFKTVGDAFCAAFATAPDALAAACDTQRALLAEDFSAVDGVRVRMALHTGGAEERDDDYFGPAVNRVARLLAIGHGGQVLVSGTAADLLQDDMPPQSSLRDLGAHRLKDLTHPEQVYQLIAQDLPETFPALRSLDALPNNLPRRLTSFVGRDDVLVSIEALIAKSPLVTLVGTGGSGKTRIAVQIGADLLASFRDGVWLIELAPISDAAQVPTAIAQALSLHESPNHAPLETLTSYLKRKRMLLIVDNCEHVIQDVRTSVATILRNCSEVRILATSREGLNVGGEELYRMPSLSVPAPSERVTAAIALRYGAIALFADRALAVDKRFALTDDNVTFVAEICRRLDGIPLAIELAAARAKLLAPRQLAQKLDERFRLLTGGDRTALPRQQTMRALIDWSHDLLSEDERTVFRRLSIFAGGFTLEVAGVVTADASLDEVAVFDVLASLVDKSLVQAEPSDGGTRYRLLESTRQYAREKLADGLERATTAQAHAAAFLTLAEELERADEGDLAWSAQAEPELDNWRSALQWSLDSRGDVLLGQRLAGTLHRAWSSLAAAEGRRWVQVARATVEAATPGSVVAKLELVEAQLDAVFGQFKASNAAAERALAHYRDLDDPLGIAASQQCAGRALVFLGRIEEAERLLQNALATARSLDARKLTGAALQNLAWACQAADNLSGARARLAEALSIYRAAGAERLAGSVAKNLAEVAFREGDAETALRLAAEALAVDRAASDILSVAIGLCNAAAYLIALRRYDDARAHAREALQLTSDLRAEVGLTFTLQHLAAVAAMRPDEGSERADDRRRAARLLGFTDARLAALEVLREYTEQHEYDEMLTALRAAHGSTELASLMREGVGWGAEQATTEALLL